jgi:RNA 3'-terminal phosphate cyclase (ATP)
MALDPLVIDGSHGEGGGQILRTAVALAAITGRPLRIERIRAGRPHPGLAAQHLTAVRAVARVCAARLVGDKLGSSVLEFVPCGSPRAGDYAFDVAEARAGGSAGAVTLVLQTLFVPLALVGGVSTLSLRGGTHVTRAPPVDYVRDVWLPTLRRMGLCADLELVRAGWYPVGGGELRARIAGGAGPASLSACDRGALVRVAGRALTSRLPAHIGERMRKRVIGTLRSVGVQVEVSTEEVEAACPGAGIFLTAEYERSRAGSSAIGARGRPAEAVADEAARELLAFHHAGAAIDAHLGDQLLVPAALASSPSDFDVSHATLHLHTNAWVIECFGLAHVRVTGKGAGPARVRVEPTVA